MLGLFLTTTSGRTTQATCDEQLYYDQPYCSLSGCTYGAPYPHKVLHPCNLKNTVPQGTSQHPESLAVLLFPIYHAGLSSHNALASTAAYRCRVS